MELFVEIADEPIESRRDFLGQPRGAVGASVEFVGIVRVEEDGREIAALEYEAYVPMAKRVIREIIEQLGRDIPALSVSVLHRVGVIPVGEAAIRVAACGRHRAEAFEMVARFMDRLKEDVPIWKRRALTSEDLSTSIEV